ncbi:hypothetical protein [uncultured Tenacibaculum sp.]|uniref:hypothetical protein n=1 Tax=uncultured Tenacibaculum sp. TaxID=174713 RepID=UPI00260311DF|nr:hypothetical protein [uncultured Tenacibaculum sp.]
MTIERIYSNGKLSVRSYHACKYNKIETILDLKEYYSIYKTFVKLKNCGEKSNLELIELCKAYSENLIGDKVITDENNLINKIQKLNRPQRQVINQFIKITTSNLKVRGRNAITSYIGKSLRLNDFLIKIFGEENFQVSKIKNIGERNILEIEIYIDKIKAYINEVSHIIDEKKLISLNNKFLIQDTFSIKEISDEVTQSQSIIKLCDFLILKNAFFKTDYTTIFKNTIDVYISDCKTLDETAEITNLTRERVRQIRQRCFEEVKDKVLLLENFEDDFYQNYDIDITENFIILTDEKVNEINFLYDTKFSKNFINYIFSIYLSKHYSIIGNLEDVLIPRQLNPKNRHKWKNIYLAKKQIQEELDFNKLFEDISLRQRERKNATYKFNFKSYLSQFLLTEKYTLLEEIKDDCERIINEEFDLFLDLDDNIVFKRNTLKTAAEYAYDALIELGEPSKVEDIYNKITQLFPGFKTDSKKVRASMKRKAGFVPIGRKSVYGLKKWENELVNFKGGTIRSIVKEYLDNLSTPIHISKITQYVLQYRPKTNEYSIIQNLKLDESKMFKFFENGVIGISGKKYESTFITLNSKPKPEKRTWEESYEVLSDFILENDRLPFSSNCPESEKILSRWLTVQKGKIKKGELNNTKVKLINEKLEKFPNRVIRNHSKNSHDIQDLLKFIEINKRLPKPTIQEEQRLYHFFYRKRKLLEKNKLPNKEFDIINKILNEHSLKLRCKNSLSNRYEKLLVFVKENKRLPSATYTNEQNLYHFFYKQRKLYENDELNDELTKLFLSIAKEIQNIKYENTRN